MRRLRIAFFIIFAALSLTWAQPFVFEIWKSGPPPQELDPATINVTYGDYEHFYVLMGGNEVDYDWEWCLAGLPISVCFSYDTYYDLSFEEGQNPTENYPWNIVINRKIKNTSTIDATRELNLTILPRVTHTVTFDANGGLPQPTPQPVLDGYKATAPTAPTKTGHTFVHWYLSDESIAFDFGNTQITASITLTAKWNIDSYNVTFNTDGGTPVPSPNPQPVQHGQTATVPQQPSKAGYDFIHWFIDPGDDNTAFSFTTPITAPITLKAKWQIKTYTVSFNADDGTPAPGPQTINHGSYASEPSTEPTKTGYTFVHWYLSDENIAFEFDDTQITASITLIAKWNINTYTVTFNYNDGITSSSSSSVQYNSSASKPTPDPERTGYTFGGWENPIGTSYNFSTPVTTDITLTAKWTIKTYTIIFNYNDETTPNSSSSVQHNGIVSEPAEPTRTGYDFGGWDSSPSYTFDSPVTTDITFTAKWTAKNYTIDFNANCPSSEFGTCPSDPVQKTGILYGAAIGTLEDITLTGYDFQGWYYNGKKYEAATPYDVDVDPGITLTAQWEIKKFTVTWKVDGETVRTDTNVPYGTTSFATPSNAPPGYKDVSWNYSSNIPIVQHETIEATFSYIDYTITYNANGGTINPSSPNSYNIKSSTITLLSATKPCIGFDGWFDNASFSGSPINSFTPNATNLGNKTFYAKWANKMTPATSDLTYTITSKTYNGYEQPIAAPSLTTASSACGLEAPTILYIYNGTSTPPKNAGSYTVQAAFNESDNYNAATITLGTLAIDKATIPSPNISAIISDKVYDATTTAQITSISLDTPLLGEDQISASNYSIISASFDDANAGQAKSVTVSITWNLPNYNTQSWPNNFTATANITQAIGYLQIQAPESYELSNPIRPIVLEKNSFVTDSEINWGYWRADTDEYSATLPKRVGEWIVKAWFSETSNYTGAMDSAKFFVERGNSSTVAHNIAFGENFDREPNFSNNQLNYFTANACNIKSADIHITVIEDDIVFIIGANKPGADKPRGDLDENGFLRYHISHAFNKPGQDTVIYTLLSKDGIYSEQDTIIIEIPIPFETITMQKWNNVLFINNNPLTNGGYEFKEFKWFKNGNAVSEMQFYSAGPSSKDTLNSSDIYKVTMHTTDGIRVSTCEGNSKNETNLGPVQSGYQKQVLGINGKTAKPGSKVYNLKGRPTQKTPAGIYIVGKDE